MMFSPFVKTTYLEILLFFFFFRKLEKNKPKQPQNVPCFGFGTICAGVLVLGKLQTTLQPSLKLTYSSDVFMFYNRTNGLKLEKKAFLYFQETLLDFLKKNFPKIVLVIILWNVMPGKRFSCWVMNQKAN